MFAIRINRPTPTILRTTRTLALMLALLMVVSVGGCKKKSGSEGGGTSGGASSASSKSPTSLSGTYESKQPSLTIAYEFKDGNRFTMTMTDAGGGDPDIAEGLYTINGNVATLEVQGGIPMQVTIKDNTLEGSMMGQTMIFTRK